jgi:hypothetical protein
MPVNDVARGDTLRLMPSEARSADELLELQRRGFELAVKEAEERQEEVHAILYSRRVLQVVEADDGLRDTRLALLEELTRASYPSAMVVAAARHLASEAGATAKATRRLHPARRLRRRWRSAVIATWGAAFGLLASGVGMSALGAHFGTSRLLVWSLFALVTGAVTATQFRWSRRQRTSGTPSNTLDSRRGTGQLHIRSSTSS